jgi:hypothetical protein
MRTEICLNKFSQARRFWFAFGKINFSQRAGDPHIDGESLLKAVREKQNAIGNF